MSRLKNAKILIVDDHRNMRKVWRNLLVGFGAQRIYDAEGAVDALELLANLDVDLVILEYYLRDLTGAELASILRKNSESPAPLVPILGCSSDHKQVHVIMGKVFIGWILSVSVEKCQVDCGRSPQYAEGLAKPVLGFGAQRIYDAEGQERWICWLDVDLVKLAPLTSVPNSPPTDLCHTRMYVRSSIMNHQ